MKRTRRNRMEMAWMKREVSAYLTRCNNDAHKAWDLYIKENIGSLRPHYIKGIKDFINVSKELEQELERDKQEVQRKTQAQKEAKEIEREILLLSDDEMRYLWKKYKDVLSKSQRLSLVDMINIVTWLNENKDDKTTQIKQEHINVYKLIKELEREEKEAI